MVTVAGVTRAHAGILEEVGGPAYLTQLLTAMQQHRWFGFDNWASRWQSI
jgi:hypothetical protein